MSRRIAVAKNDTCSVTYDYDNETVCVFDLVIDKYKYYAGWDELHDLFWEFFHSFNDEVTSCEAYQHFAPNTGQTVIKLK